MSNGLPNLLRALESEDRNNGQGVVTICNHISTLDEPLTWGILPTRTYWTPRQTRWTLGAADILFTNRVLSTFFRHGQVLKTVRGAGIYQPAVDAAIEKLRQGEWVHLFGEGYVSQPNTYIVNNGVGRLRRFKWGIGRIIMETPRPPTIIPMWLTGFEDLMPEGRRFPFNFMPRFGAKLSVTFGKPIPHEDITIALQRESGFPSRPTTMAGSWATKSEAESLMGDYPKLDAQNRDIRIAVTSVVQRAVEELGRSVSGLTLGSKQVK